LKEIVEKNPDLNRRGIWRLFSEQTKGEKREYKSISNKLANMKKAANE
jgi:hypothetical protein